MKSMREKLSDADSVFAIFEIVKAIKKENSVLGFEIFNMAVVEAMKDQWELDIAIVKDYAVKFPDKDIDSLIEELQRVSPDETPTPTS